ncbi:hypothetical protein HPB50_000008 [Hyalomma asiaticum]|uniref:Uncharacterized protein n=1 Tax=Hyalomma asiaticum TaxID=266040 RepID=A0ACB7RZB2_HYAAI|nr:hypothetical protein HPB50_000008 [Hyalomma asiaticum]
MLGARPCSCSTCIPSDYPEVHKAWKKLGSFYLLAAIAYAVFFVVALMLIARRRKSTAPGGCVNARTSSPWVEGQLPAAGAGNTV